MSLKLDYLEFPSADLAASKRFFETVFGWDFTDYGTDYSAFRRKSAGLDGGIYSGEPAPGGALAVLYSADIDQALDSVKAAGGEITKAIFGFPGGKRFEFDAPGGIRLAVWTHEADPKDA